MFKKLKKLFKNKQLTKITSNKNKKTPNTTNAAISCEGNPPLEID